MRPMANIRASHSLATKVVWAEVHGLELLASRREPRFSVKE